MLDKTKAWDSEENIVPSGRGMEGGEFVLHERDYRCPANCTPIDSRTPWHAHYVGIAGVGANVACRPTGYPETGVFGYDRSTRLSEITRGTSTVMMVAETAFQTGPWTAGGTSTVRGLDSENPPYLGLDGQFSAKHRYPAGWIFPSRYATNVLFVDGSVRSFTESRDPRVLEAMAVIAGHNDLGRLGDD